MPKTLLLADDSVVIQKLVALSFANEDVELVTVYNGDDAVAKAREVRPDLVLADVVMPGQNGYEVCEAIKKDPGLGQVPVLLLTGTFEAFDDDRAQQAGADGHITKPFEAQALVDRVTELLNAAPAPAPAAETPSALAEPSAEAASGDGAFEFFDDELSEPLASSATPEPAAPAKPRDDGFAFGHEEPLSFGDAPSLDTGAPADPGQTGDMGFGSTDMPDDAGDHTIAIMPEDPAPTGDSPPPLPETPTLSVGGIDEPGRDRTAAGDPMPVPPPLPASTSTDPLAPIADPAATIVADASFSAGVTPDPAQTVLTDAPAASEPAGETPSFDGDDLFGDGPGGDPTPLGAEGVQEQAPAASADDLDFSFGGPPGGSAPELDLGGEDWGSPAGESAAGAQLDPKGSSGYDISSSDLGSPLAAAKPPTPEAPTTPEPRAAEAEPLVDTTPDISTGAASAAAGLSDVMRDRVHETLEKVAWEAFADLSETIVRQVLQRVEQVAWEVIPQMAETLIQEEIRKLKNEDGD